ncbi:CYTH domain-containing protein [Sedimenticola selenatireducens]|jgi:adenylate cyclase|uniref:CYTH domain-containing protein n=1 Tax=Sedimenticola selenatireducens TaxID=191960 RepID=A0A558DQ41_9GAMM|nr:CYTH domain-containing protein [Sedimenticola selenatireducens]TVO70511.1 CYTH domain-containing protein [Sedimenticola selenatireducens]TVT63088.1 MAG: CYTH domain-containing protein [Sedimenticola selenatireducens]
MAVEIERKYLVINDKWKKSVVSESVLKQGYIVNQPNVTVRVRIAKGKAHLNIKSATIGITRAEYEYEIPLSDAENILEDIAEQPFIDKTRFKVRCGDHIWDLDVFYGDNSGLVMAEIELDSEDEAFEYPEWAGEEVSSDPRYYNSSLVKKPYSTW